MHVFGRANFGSINDPFRLLYTESKWNVAWINVWNSFILKFSNIYNKYWKVISSRFIKVSKKKPHFGYFFIQYITYFEVVRNESQCSVSPLLVLSTVTHIMYIELTERLITPIGIWAQRWTKDKPSSVAVVGWPWLDFTKSSTDISSYSNLE